MSKSYAQLNILLGAGGGSSTATVYPNFSSFPGSAASGTLAFDSSTGTLYVWDFVTSSWISLNNVSVTTAYKPEAEITLNSTDISNGYIILNEAPLTKNKTRVGVIGGLFASYGTDFVVTTDDGGKRLSWTGLGLASLLEAGDILVITYN